MRLVNGWGGTVTGPDLGSGNMEFDSPSSDVKNKYYVRSIREWFNWNWELLTKCKLKDQHHEKLQSWGKCYRCGKCLSPPCY